MQTIDPQELASPSGRIPTATYRLQFHRDFTFQAGFDLIPYLNALGISDLYASPCLAAKPGSMHGYDICDHSRFNSELGSGEDFDELSRTLSAHRMGLLLDFVPNHMGADPEANPWWRDVLENGRSSRWAPFFDIDWDSLKPELKNKVLLPILGKHYGEALEAGELQLEFQDGALALRYFERNLPINARQEAFVYRQGIGELSVQLGNGASELSEFLSVVEALDQLPPSTDSDPSSIERRSREARAARDRLTRLVESSSAIRERIEDKIRLFNGRPGEPASFDLLHQLLESQPYRLAYWRTATQEINYRRFFNINDLAAIRMENPEVFAATHHFVLRLIREGKATGLRLDHVDGLFDPQEYFERLQGSVRSQPGESQEAEKAAAGATQEAMQGAADRTPRKPLYVVVEKILSAGESLPDDWAVHGTTGYDFLNEINGLFIDSRNAHRLGTVYTRFAGRDTLISDTIHESKKLIMTASMAGELNVLAHELNRISERDRRTRDFTLESLREALREVTAAFPVYRTYIGPSGWKPPDRKHIETAISRAKRRNPAMEPSIFDFLATVLLARREDLPTQEYDRRVQFTMKLQQYTGPVEAKGLEDTAFYRYVPLLSINEVGGDLYRFGVSVAEFHEANLARRQHWPSAMLSTASHDTKRGEDARARMNVISEIPDLWRARLNRWRQAHAGILTEVDGQPAPDGSDEYLFYQTLLGVWPAEGVSQPPDGLVERVRAYMLKAIKEAKVHTSWIHPNEAYEQAVSDFVEQALTGPGARRFLSSFVRFQRRTAPWGMINSLSQVVLKMVSPGVPDFYQGAELWDLSLVDPDNRRPVDYGLRRGLLDEMQPLVEQAASGSPESLDRSAAASEMLQRWPDGRVKLYTTLCGLRLRLRLQELFLQGDYLPLEAAGEHADHLVALARTHQDQAIIATVPRLVATLSGLDGPLPLGEMVWKDTQLKLPPALAGRAYRNVFTGERCAADNDALSAAEALKTFPVAILQGPV